MDTCPILLKDFYKVDHRSQYPKGTTLVYSNFTPRGSRLPGVNSVVVFGLQYFVKEYLVRRFDKDFFARPKAEVIGQYKRRMDNALGKDTVKTEHLEALHDLGYLPLHIKALPEGTLCPMRVPVLTIWNTLPEFFWLTNFIETIMSSVLWGAMTSATIAHEYRKLLDAAAERTGGDPAFVQWQGHDFSMRGMYGSEASAISGAAHLLSFTGTDTIPAIDFLEKYYEADCEKELIGGSVPATEHSVMCMGGSDCEVETFTRLLTSVYPRGVVSVVSDTWDYWRVFDSILPRLRELILHRDGKLVIRPDSGDPVAVICGEPGYAGSIERLWSIFGGSTNSRGYRQLDPHIGLIYGDSITLERARAIVSGLEAKGFASTNVVLGIGSYTYQYNTRDTFGFAMKSTYGVVDGRPINIYKDPRTDDGVKKSAKGLLRVNKDMTLSEEVSWEEEGGELKTVFIDGQVFSQSLAEIRARLAKKEPEFAKVH